MKKLTDEMLADVRAKAVALRAGLAKLPHVQEVSGLGLMVGIAFEEGISAKEVLTACQNKGLLCLTAKTRLRLLPPLVLTNEDIEKALFSASNKGHSGPPPASQARTAHFLPPDFSTNKVSFR